MRPVPAATLNGNMRYVFASLLPMLPVNSTGAAPGAHEAASLGGTGIACCGPTPDIASASSATEGAELLPQAASVAAARIIKGKVEIFMARV
jgi:hypothetical protein